MKNSCPKNSTTNPEPLILLVFTPFAQIVPRPRRPAAGRHQWSPIQAEHASGRPLYDLRAVWPYQLWRNVEIDRRTPNSVSTFGIREAGALMGYRYGSREREPLRRSRSGERAACHDLRGLKMRGRGTLTLPLPGKVASLGSGTEVRM